MEKSINNKFKSNLNFVKPLYKRTKVNDRNNSVKSIIEDFDSNIKLCGDDYKVKTVVTKSGGTVINVKRNISKEYKVILPGACGSDINIEDVQNFKGFNNTNNQITFDNFIDDNKNIRDNMLDNNNIKKDQSINKDIDNNELSQGLDKTNFYHKVPDTWLRVYPAKKIPGESFHSILLRCFLCQLGLTTFLVLWTIVGVFIIQSYEGPQEAKVSLQFEKEQNQLVIDLATELRQITPLSPRWRYAIEKRIGDERQLTMKAVGDGVRIKPGRFWNLPGTFLFTIYVMTALGFGAPVPHTILGRTFALIYALLAIPVHIYLMMNVSMCLIIHADAYMKYLKENFFGRPSEHKSGYKNQQESANCSRNSEILKSSLRWRNIFKCVSILGIGRCIPLATLSYYVLGVVAFGVLRSKTPLETVMFPLEFTTTGGLERVEGYVRIFYGFYVEGAMCLLACILASLRRYGTSIFSSISETYRLFETDTCEQCNSKERV